MTLLVQICLTAMLHHAWPVNSDNSDNVSSFVYHIWVFWCHLGIWKRNYKIQEQGRESNQQHSQPTQGIDTQGFAPGLHWWEVEALITAPFLLTREIARANWTYFIYLSFVIAVTIAVGDTFPLLQNPASSTEATFLALTAARSRRVVTCPFTAAWIILFSFSLTVFL